MPLHPHALPTETVPWVPLRPGLSRTSPACDPRRMCVHVAAQTQATRQTIKNSSASAIAARRLICNPSPMIGTAPRRRG